MELMDVFVRDCLSYKYIVRYRGGQRHLQSRSHALGNEEKQIHDECTVFVAELLCLNFAIEWIAEQNSVISEYLICTDSLTSLDYLKCISSSNNIIIEIQKQLKSLKDKNISIDFTFVVGHTGVVGNERADWLAKAKTKRKIDITDNFPKLFYKITKKRTVKLWNQEYLISSK
ncbi:uncharacterized protein TNCV_2541861 [Trichonephila clavipes]|nr:uncharacterized protein TNCV_2541861 [Trichonephila clavipes]